MCLSDFAKLFLGQNPIFKIVQKSLAFHENRFSFFWGGRNEEFDIWSLSLFDPFESVGRCNTVLQTQF